MITSRRVAINGQQLDQVDSRIVIQGFDLKAGKDTFATAEAYGRPGLRVTACHRDSVDVQVKFSIRARKNTMAERTEVLDAANAWARMAAEGAWITSNEREGQRIRARIAQYPDPGDQWNWTNTYTFTFRAYDAPYWQDVSPNLVRRAGARNENIILNIGGNMETVVEAEFTNTSGGTVNTLQIATGSAVVRFTGLGLRNGQVFRLTHAENGRLIATCGGAGCLAKMAPESSDDAWIEPGTGTINFQADGAGTLTLQATGRYV